MASHYRNTPDDLLLLSDAPAHRLFALLGPVDDAAAGGLPDVLAVIQVALEGAVSKRSAAAALAAGQAPGGDLIPWTVGQQFQDAEFPGLSGARVVRLAVHPDLQRAGYGSRALELLARYYEGDLSGGLLDGDGGGAGGAAGAGVALSRDAPGGAEAAEAAAAAGAGAGASLLEEQLRPRAGLPPLLVALADRPPERLHWLGASFGLTLPLLAFWRRARYAPVYLRQTPAATTGEHTVVVLRALSSPDVLPPEGAGAGADWAAPFVADFRCRLTSLLAGAFREFEPGLALSLLDPRLRFPEAEGAAADAAAEAAGAEGAAAATAANPEPAARRADGALLSPHDLKRLQAYAAGLVDHHLVLDLVPPLARAYFAGHIPVTLSYAQAAVLLVLGLQQRSVDAAAAALDLPGAQALALFGKAARRLHGRLRAAAEAAAAAALPRAPRAGVLAAQLAPHAQDLDEELAEGAAAEMRKQRAALAAAMRAAVPEEELAQYAVRGGEADFEAAAGGGAPAAGGVVSVRAGGKRPPREPRKEEPRGGKGRGKDARGGKYGGGGGGKRPKKGA